MDQYVEQKSAGAYGVLMKGHVSVSHHCMSYREFVFVVLKLVSWPTDLEVPKTALMW